METFQQTSQVQHFEHVLLLSLLAKSSDVHKAHAAFEAS
jgi:hypothetical protein